MPFDLYFPGAIRFHYGFIRLKTCVTVYLSNCLPFFDFYEVKRIKNKFVSITADDKKTTETSLFVTSTEQFLSFIETSLSKRLNLLHIISPSLSRVIYQNNTAYGVCAQKMDKYVLSIFHLFIKSLRIMVTGG